MPKSQATTFIKAKEQQVLRSRAGLRPRDPKMDAVVRAVHGAPHFDVAAAAATVSNALATSSEKERAWQDRLPRQVAE